MCLICEITVQFFCSNLALQTLCILNENVWTLSFMVAYSGGENAMSDLENI